MMWSFQQSWEGGLSLTTAVKSLWPPVRGGVPIKCSGFVSISFRCRGGDISGQIPGQCPQDLNVERGRVYDGDVDADPEYIFFDLLVPDDWLGHRRSSFVYRMSIFYCFHSIYFTIFLVLQSRIMSSVKCINTLKQVPEASKGRVNGGYHSENPKIEDWL